MGRLLHYLKIRSAKMPVENGVLLVYRGKEEHVIIPDGVTTIGAETFYGCAELKSIIIPDSIKHIEQRAFEFCKNLNHVRIPDGVTSFGYRTFGDCTSLTDLQIPDSIVRIDANAFNRGVDDDIPWLKQFSDDFIIIGKVLFRYQGTQKHVTIPDTVVTITDYAFRECQTLESLTIPDTVKKIEKDACYSCTNLKRITYHGIQVFLCEILRFRQAMSLIENIHGFLSNPADREALERIMRNISNLFLTDSATFRKLLATRRIFTRDNIDKAIQYAIDYQQYEIQIMLTDYKAKNNWYDDSEEEIRKKFEL